MKKVNFLASSFLVASLFTLSGCSYKRLDSNSIKIDSTKSIKEVFHKKRVITYNPKTTALSERFFSVNSKGELTFSPKDMVYLFDTPIDIGFVGFSFAAKLRQNCDNKMNMKKCMDKRVDGLKEYLIENNTKEYILWDENSEFADDMFDLAKSYEKKMEGRGFDKNPMK